MNFLKSFKVLVLIIIASSVKGAFSKEFYCQLNYAPFGSELSLEDAKKFLKSFNFQTESPKGIKIEFEGDEYLLWNKDKHIQLKFTDKNTAMTFQTQFAPSESEYFVKISPNREFKCLDKAQKAKAVDFPPDELGAITNDSILPSYTENIELQFTSNLTFKYIQHKVVGLMRPIIFQKGKLLTADSPLDTQENFCSLQIQVKLNEDISVSRDTIWKIVRVDNFSNSEKFNVYTYNFVDFATGKKGQSNSYYSPFALECQIKKSDVFTYGLFRQMTNNTLAIKFIGPKKD